LRSIKELGKSWTTTFPPQRVKSIRKIVPGSLTRNPKAILRDVLMKFNAYLFTRDTSALDFS